MNKILLAALMMMMMKKNARWFLLLLGLLVVTPVFSYAAIQATFYVAPDGDDSNPGTISAPFKTITAARDAVRTINASMTGDIYVYLRGGVYPVESTIVLKPVDSGKNGFRVYYKAYEDEVPVISGAVKVTGWTLHNGSIYKA
ncbi:MAG: right-handed parallel beta-helix repeat-containing protein, partial [Fibrobacterota bacterium]